MLAGDLVRLSCSLVGSFEKEPARAHRFGIFSARADAGAHGKIAEGRTLLAGLAKEVGRGDSRELLTVSGDPSLRGCHTNAHRKATPEGSGIVRALLVMRP